MDLRKTFGNIDVYLFDQLLKGRFDDCKKVLDAGCGEGRNLVYFLQNGFNVYGLDQNEEAIQNLQVLAKELSPGIDVNQFKIGKIEDLPFEENYFDLVICNAVLHFAKDKEHFERMLMKMWSVLQPGGYFLARLASDIGIEGKVVGLGNGRYLLPDDSERYLVNEKMLLDYTRQLNGELVEWIKTTNVQGLRCMTTWIVKKN